MDKKEFIAKYIRHKEIFGKESEVHKYIEENGEKLTFGILKSIFHDALEYKKKRELMKGGAKMALRIVSIAGSVIWFPLWILNNIFGVSRALDKVLIPVLNDPTKHNYNGFLNNFINAIIEVSEGDIRPILGKDWFYDVFMIKGKIHKMIRSEILQEFAAHLANQIQNENDSNEVPPHYVENQLRKYLSENYEISPPIPALK